MKTELCDRLGIEHPILSVGFGAGAGPELVAAVSNAGASACWAAGLATRAGETWEVPRYGAVMPSTHFTGDLEAISWWAGQSVSLVHDIKPAGRIVRDIVREAEEVIDRLARIRTAPQAIPAR